MLKNKRVNKSGISLIGREDNITKRICVSKSIIGCLQSTSVYQTRK